VAHLRDHVSPTTGKVTYSVTWREGRSQPSLSFKTKGEALTCKKEVERKKRAEKAQGIRRPDRVRYGEFSERWFSEAVSRLTVKVQRQYEGYWRRNIEPYWGTTALSDITRDRLPAWVKWMEKRGVAVSSIHESMVVFRSSLSYAVEVSLIPANPASGRKRYMPRYTPSQERPELTPAQVLELATAAGEDGLMIMVMTVLALRPGEAIGLQAGDVRDDHLSIERSIVKVAGLGMVEGRTKNRKTRRVPMMFLAGELRALAAAKKSGELLFPGPNGYWNSDSLKYKARKAGERIGVAGLNSSDLRHVAITNILELTGDVKFASEVAGHESGPAITLKHYVSLTKAMEKDAIKKLAEAYGAG
jgi:integrase